MAEPTPGVDKVPNRGPLFMIASSTLTAFACALVFFRMSSTVKRKVVGIEDVLVGLSAVCQIVNHTVGCLAVHYGFGRHRTDIDRSGGDIVHALLYFYLFQVFYKFVLCLNKLSFLFLYMRLFPTPKFRIVCLASIAIVAGGTLGFVVATIMQCIPIEKYWERPLPGHCVDNMAFRWSWAPFNTILDIWVCLMPLPVIRRLQMDTLKKAGIMLLFLLGLFVCVTSIIRMEALVDSTTTHDATWGSFMALLWSSIEASTGIICACIPYLKQPIKKLFPILRSRFHSSASSSREKQNHYIEKVPSKPIRRKEPAIPTLLSTGPGDEEEWTENAEPRSGEISPKNDACLTSDERSDSMSEKRMKSTL